MLELGLGVMSWEMTLLRVIRVALIQPGTIIINFYFLNGLSRHRLLKYMCRHLAPYVTFDTAIIATNDLI